MSKRFFISIFVFICLFVLVKTIIDKKDINQNAQEYSSNDHSFEFENNNPISKKTNSKNRLKSGSSIQDESDKDSEDEPEIDEKDPPDSHSYLKKMQGNWAINNKTQKFGQQEISDYLKNRLLEEFNTYKKDVIVEKLNKTDANESISKINYYMDSIIECYTNEDPMCNSNTDPKSNYFNKAWDLVYFMDILMKLNNVNDNEKKEITKKLSGIDNDWVREKNLQIIASMPSNPANLDLSIETIENSSDPGIYKTFADEATKKYKDEDSIDKITELFLDTIKNGGFFLGKEVAFIALDFMTPSNINKYNKLLEELNSKSYRYIALKQTIEEYQKAHPVKN